MTTRKDFLKTSLLAAAGSALGGRLVQPALGGRLVQSAPYARVRGANDAIRIGVVGIGSSVKIGGKGKQDIRAWRKIPGVRIVALCDCERAHLDPEVKKCRDLNEPVEAYTDVRDLLANKEIDAVSITTPNHWHALVSIWACQAGKDVFVQKPASHNIFEGRKMVEAARKYNRIVLSTAGPRGRTGMGEAFEWARRGNLGKVLYVHGLNYRPRTSIGKVAAPTPVPKTLDYNLWSGPVLVLPIWRQYLHYDWHWDWETGNGDLGNMGIHYMDGCRMALGVDTLPERVVSIGGRFGYDDDGETPNTLITLLDYEPTPIIFEVRGLPKDKSFLKTNWEKGAQNTMDSYRGIRIGTIMHCENGYIAGNEAFDRDGKLIREFEPTNEDLMQNFAKAVRSRRVEDLQSDILEGHLSAALVHMANISYRVGAEASPRRIREAIGDEREFAQSHDWLMAHLEANGIDPKKTLIRLGASLRMNPSEERFVEGLNCDLANEYRTRAYRQPFVVPETV